jgi:hypothetical protein
MQGTSPGDGLNLIYHFSRPQRFARWGLFFEHDMSTYKTLVDFRLFNHADMWEACKGFRSVIHKAIYTADVELAALLRGHLQQLLDIDEDIEDREGFAFAAGAALAHQMRSRK